MFPWLAHTESFGPVVLLAQLTTANGNSRPTVELCEIAHKMAIGPPLQCSTPQNASLSHKVETKERKERKVQRFSVQFKNSLNQLSLSHESNKKDKREKQNKNTPS